MHAAADDRDRLCPTSALPVRTEGVGAANRVDAQLTERAVEEAVIGAATEFAIRDKFEAQSLLQLDRLGNGVIFGVGELSPLAKRARSRSKLAGRSRLPICSARNGGFAAAALATECVRTFTKRLRYPASSPHPLSPSLPIPPTVLLGSGCRFYGVPLRCGCRARRATKFPRIRPGAAAL
jgi:hypothetical protein